ncbi:MAG TPA: carbon-nitrogen family hydrolase [Phycisphaeraceae bacterium]
MQVIGCQFDIAWQDKATNHERVAALLERADVEPGALIVLPEMFATGYSMNVDEIHEDDSGPTHRFLAELAQRHGAFVLGGVVTRDASSGKGRNEAVVFDPAGRPIARYAKMRPMTVAGEADSYQAGRQVVTFPWHGATVAPLICYDLRFPELFRAAARQGAQLYAVIASFPAVREHHWLTLLTARAIENQAYVIGVNRCGRDPKLEYTGRSIIVDPRGQVLADAGEREGIVQARIDLAELQAYRQRFPALLDMRDDDVDLAGRPACQ